VNEITLKESIISFKELEECKIYRVIENLQVQILRENNVSVKEFSSIFKY
jgi:hypothetical protein